VDLIGELVVKIYTPTTAGNLTPVISPASNKSGKNLDGEYVKKQGATNALHSTEFGSAELP
jgi:hypothetical protein